MTVRVADRLAMARKRLFVGREAEKQLFRTVVDAVEPPFFILHLYGPGGIGKSSLLREFMLMAQNEQIKTLFIDARQVDPTPDDFLAVLRSVLAIPVSDDPIAHLQSREERFLLCIDTFELLLPLEIWLREHFLPELPATVIVVLAGRDPLSATWRADLGWSALIRTVPVRNLTPEESRAFLRARTIASEQHDAIAHLTHGHPLAISLVADVLMQNPELPIESAVTPDLMQILLERFVQENPSPAHRLALEASACVHYMTESLLTAMLDMPAVHDIFVWLRDLSFMDVGHNGLFPHDIVRDTLVAELRWRNPDWYAELHERARKYYLNRLRQTHGPAQRQTLLDLVFLHRDNFLLRPYFERFIEGNDTQLLWLDRITPVDEQAMLAMVHRHEGARAAALAAHWFAHPSATTTVVRDHEQKVQGFLTIVMLHGAPAHDLAADPATQIAAEYLRRHAPLRPGEIAIYYRFWLDSEEYQAMSPVQSRIFLLCLQTNLTTPGLAYTFFTCADPDFWSPIFTYAGFARLADADFEVDERRFGVYAHDWRVHSPADWLMRMAQQEMALGLAEPPSAPVASTPVLVLSQPEFADAVRAALRSCTRLSELQTNPLLRSRLVLDAQATGSAGNEAATVLQALIKQAAEQLQASPRQRKLYRALYHTYLQPAATQELAAELIDVPFSSYRRHLKAGVDEVIECLWQQELSCSLA